MNLDLLGIYAARGHGRDTLLFAPDCYSGKIVFIDDRPLETTLHGHPVVSFAEFLDLESSRRAIAIAIADPKARTRIWTRVESAGIEVVSLCAKTAIVWSKAELGPGALISPLAVISTGVKAGRGLIANTMAAIAHDCILGDFVTVGPGAKVNGCVHVADRVLIGAGAQIKQGTLEQPRRIGTGAVVGMGAVVTHDVGDFETVAGNPARVLICKS